MDSRRGLSRRQFMQLSATVSTTALLAACTPGAAPAGGGESGSAPAGDTILLRYQSREPERAAGIAELSV